jgi:hypothetical protein
MGNWQRDNALRLVAAACVLALLAGLTACGSATKTATTSSTALSSAVPSATPPASDAELMALIKSGGLSAIRAKYGEPAGPLSQPWDSIETCQLSDGTQLYFEWGLTASGVPVVISHSVADTLPPSVAFTKAITDGKTTLDQANAYLTKESSGTWEPAVVTNGSPVTIDYLWTFADGSGFVVQDLSAWSPADRLEYWGSKDTTLAGYTWRPDHIIEDATGG